MFKTCLPTTIVMLFILASITISTNAQLAIESDFRNPENEIIKIKELLSKGNTLEEIKQQFHSLKSRSGSGSISGFVYESDGITPLQSLGIVYVYEEYGAMVGLEYVFEEGFIVNNIPESKCYVSVFTLTQQLEFFDNVIDWRDATLVDVKDGEEVSGINFTLDSFENLYSGAISGRITDSKQVGLANCNIMIIDEKYENYRILLSDAEGYYFIAGLPDDNYIISASPNEDINFIPDYYKSNEDEAIYSLVNVSNSDTTKNIDIILQAGGGIQGKIFDHSGSQLGDYSSSFRLYDKDSISIDSRISWKDGTFVITQVPTGNYKLFVDPQYDPSHISEWYNGHENFSEATEIIVRAPDTTNLIDINLQKGGSISGQIFDYNERLISGGCLVQVFDDNNRQIAYAWSQSQGMYEVGGLPTGSYKLFVNFQGNQYGDGKDPVDSWYGGDNFDNAEIINVAVPETIYHLDMHLSKGGAIRGRVLGEDGENLTYDCSIYAYDSLGVFYPGSISNTGSYYVSGLKAGKYVLRAFYYGQDAYLSEWYDDKSFRSEAIEVIVEDQRLVSNINFHLDKYGILNGFVVDEKGNRLTNVTDQINIVAWDEASGEVVSSTVNTFTGGYTLLLRKGDYKISANRYAYSIDDNLATTFLGNGYSYFDSHSTILEVLPDDHQKLEDIVLPRVAGFVSGTIYSPLTDEPAIRSKYDLYTYDTAGYLNNVSSFNSFAMLSTTTGEYDVKGLVSGDYYMLVRLTIGSESWGRWYGGIDMDFETSSIGYKVNIPDGARLVTVEDSQVEGIDFFFGKATSVEEYLDAQTNLQAYGLSSYPNPFYAQTNIQLDLTESSSLSGRIYNYQGQLIKTLFENQDWSNGSHTIIWDGTNNSSQSAPAGMYFIKIQGDKGNQTSKCMLLR